MRQFKVIYNKAAKKKGKEKQNVLKKAIKNSMKANGTGDQGYRYG